MFMSTKEWKTAKETSNTWYKKQEKKEEQEVQNTLTLKSVAKFCIIKYQQFQEYE